MLWTKAVLLGASAFLATPVASGAVPHEQEGGNDRVLQDEVSEEQPTVGLKFLDETTSFSVDSERVSPSVHERLFETFQSDARVTGRSNIKKAISV